MRNLTNEASYALAERLIAEAAEQNATHLDLSSLRLIDLPPSLAQLTQLQSLDLSDNYWLQDIRVLGELGQLQTLNLNKCGQLGILSPLAALTQLRELQLILNQPQHAAVLARLSSLEQLNVQNHTTNTGVQWLGHLPRLQKLVLSSFRHHGIQTPLPPLPDLQELKLRSFTPCQALLANLPQLKALSLAPNGFGSSATPLQLQTLALPKGLQQLQLFHSALEGLGALDRLQQLTHLDIDWCDMDATQLSLAQLVTLASLKIHTKDSSATSFWPQLPALQQLQQLSLTSAQVVDLAVLTALPSLQDITMLGDTWPENWPALQTLPNLKQLSMLAASLTDYRQLGQLPSLHSLDLAQCIHLTSLDWLQGLPGLQLLSLRLCEQLSDVRGLHAVPSLTELGLSHCPQLRTLEGLEQCQRLQRLDLDNLPNLQRLDSVSTLTSLQDASLFECEQLQDLTPLAGLKLLSEINMAGCLHIVDASAIATLPSLQTLTITRFPLLNNLQPLASAPVLQRLSLPVSKLPQDASEFTALRDLQMPGIELADLWQLPRLVEFGNYLDAQEIPSVPAELLLEDDDFENRLPALLSWQQDLLTSGESAVDELKVFILGNGRVGKTQLARGLQALGFDDTVASTHGIEIGEFPLLKADRQYPALTGRLWDFGGQDVYLNTHRLFLDERAIYVLAWHPDFENEHTQYEDGVPMRNRPLAYWLAYIRAHAGPDAPIIVVQTRCEDPEQQQAPPLPDNHGFRHLHYCASSAQTEEGMEQLWPQLKQAARLLRQRLAEVRIPQNWLAVAADIRVRKEAGDKLLAFAEFAALCGQHYTQAPPDLLADYLHRSGKLFWQRNAFAGQLVLDQQWALQGLYALLQRNGPLAMLREQFGCFSSTQLAMTAWRDFPVPDQQQYLQMMLQCGSCFPLGAGQFLAPELLPSMARRQHDIDAIWRDGEAAAHIVLQYGFLHDGIIHAVLSAIGKLAGRAAVYWHDGVCYYDRSAKGAVRITARRATLPTQDYGGSLDIEVQGSHAANLARHLLDSVQSIRLREQAQVQWLRGSPESHPAAEEDRPEPFSVIDPDPAISQLISAPDSRLIDTPAKPRQILAFATEWTSRHGGLSTFNRELCTALATQGAQVCCVVEQADEQEIKTARQDNVTLLLPPAGGDSARSNMLRPLPLPAGFTPDILIGHGRITGDIALAQQKDFYQSAKRIHFLHMAAGEIEWFKGKDNAAQTAEQRDRQELELMRGASLIAAVGPKLKAHATDLLNALPVEQRGRVIDFRPGFRIAESYGANTVNFQCLMLCRAEDSELKGIDIAAHALAKLDGSKLQFQPELVIRGAVSGSGTQLQQVLQAQHSNLVVSVREYQPGEAVIEDLRRASLLLMPSRSEGFGLVALEALRVGTPILASSETGFAMMLKELLTPHQWANFIVDTPSSPGQAEKAADNWQREIELQLRDFDAAKRRAAELGKLLSEKLNWSDACRLLLGMSD
ncbi:COR domain-containing protein [Vogesella indigofera]|uniref:COR domain-containing protein n=1 Tax=Vogesella indigofera TaxID=45465 RepID=UPI00234DC1A5|nr:COR domain-containing protein [Vogesella indigofera]MDC7703594.1 COR domain-containing protein [Vogesella indigofera]